MTAASGPPAKNAVVREVVALTGTEARRDLAAGRCEIENRINLLTPQEHQVMAWIVAGKASEQAEAEMGISTKTVEVHRARVMRKLQLKSSPALVELVLMQRHDSDRHSRACG